jgi:hypothetical protein
LADKLTGEFPRVWLNNAGLDGHSTRGHRLLLDELVGPLRPKVVLYLVGLNDVGMGAATLDDESLLRSPAADDSWLRWAYLELVNHSALFALADNVRRHLAAEQAGLTHGNVDHIQLRLDAAAGVVISDDEREAVVERHRRDFLPGYEQRLSELLSATRSYGIEPVLITQPALYGDAVDDETGVDLGRVKVGQVDGRTQWQVLQLYNDATLRVGRQMDLPVIDLAAQLPKTSAYYYDYHHYTNAGAEAVAQVVFEGLRNCLKDLETAQGKSDDSNN